MSRCHVDVRGVSSVAMAKVGTGISASARDLIFSKVIPLFLEGMLLSPSSCECIEWVSSACSNPECNASADACCNASSKLVGSLGSILERIASWLRSMWVYQPPTALRNCRRGWQVFAVAERRVCLSAKQTRLLKTETTDAPTQNRYWLKCLNGMTSLRWHTDG